LERYRQLREVADPDAVQDLVARHGPAILDRSLPYLVVSARNEQRGRARKASARREVSYAAPPDQQLTPRTWDPLARVASNDQLRRVLEALASLDDRDVLVVWRRAEGVTDDEIRAEWDARGFMPPHPNDDAIRKRRERARARLRTMLGEVDDLP
jgi:hypothetical protein